MNLTLTIASPDTLRHRGIIATDALRAVDGLQIEATGFGDRVIFQALQDRIPGLSTHPYSTGVEVRSNRRYVGDVVVSIPAQRTPVDDLIPFVDSRPSGRLVFLGIGRRP